MPDRPHRTQESQTPRAVICRCHHWGKHALVMTVAEQLKREMGLVPKDVLAFRVFTIRGRRVMVGEKVPLTQLANMLTIPDEIIRETQK